MGNDLIAMIKSKKQQIAQLQAELDEAMRELRAEPHVSVPAVRPAVAARRQASRKGARPAATVGQRRHRRPDTSTAWSEALMQELGPLHIDDLLKGIEQRFHRRLKKATLVGNLARKVKARDTFVRTAPSTYGLIEGGKERQLKFGA